MVLRETACTQREPKDEVGFSHACFKRIIELNAIDLFAFWNLREKKINYNYRSRSSGRMTKSKLFFKKSNNCWLGKHSVFLTD